MNIKVFAIVLMLIRHNYGNVKIKGNKIKCSGYLNQKLCNDVKRSMDIVYDSACKYSTKKTIQFAPIVLGISSMNGDRDPIENLIKQIKNEYDCPIYTVNERMIGGYSTHLFLAGNRRIFHETSVMYIPNIHHDKTQEYYLDNFGSKVPMCMLTSKEAKLYGYCDKIIP